MARFYYNDDEEKDKVIGKDAVCIKKDYNAGVTIGNKYNILGLTPSKNYYYIENDNGVFYL